MSEAASHPGPAWRYVRRCLGNQADVHLRVLHLWPICNNRLLIVVDFWPISKHRMLSEFYMFCVSHLSHVQNPNRVKSYRNHLKPLSVNVVRLGPEPHYGMCAKV